MVSSTRHYLDLCLRLSTGVYTRWNNLVPIKLNILLRRISWNKLPTRLNLRDKRVDIVYVLCQVCSKFGESSNNLFIVFPLLVPLWSHIARRWEIDIPPLLSVHSLITWADEVSLSAENRQISDAVVIITFWTLWNYMNNLIFGAEKPKEILFLRK